MRSRVAGFPPRVNTLREVRRAIHVRTGQRAAVEAVDAWLAGHGVDVVGLPDVYAACVHILQHYADVPDLVLLGADWLAEDEFALLTYVRQTWPRAGVIVYGSPAGTPLLDILPLMRTCRTEAALRALLAEPPAAVLDALFEQAAALAAPLPAPEAPAAPAPARPDVRAEGARRAEPGPAPPRALLSPAELAALLGGQAAG